jgi:hypothetical protein
MFRALAILILIAVVGYGGLFVAAGRSQPPVLTIEKPDRAVGQQSDLQITAGAPRARFVSLVVTLEQNGRTTPLFALDNPGSATLAQPDADHLRVTRPLESSASQSCGRALRASWSPPPGNRS